MKARCMALSLAPRSRVVAAWERWSGFALLLVALLAWHSPLLAQAPQEAAPAPSELVQEPVADEQVPAQVQPDASGALEVPGETEPLPAVQTEAPPVPPEPIASKDRPEAVLRVILGLLALTALAYLGGHKRVIELERKLGISQVITAGLPFLLLGMVARQPAVGVLTDSVLNELRPVLLIGLGSIGFVAGFRFEAKLFQGLPQGTGTIALLSTFLPFAAVALATAPLLVLFSGADWRSSLQDPVFVRDALILATAGASTARSAVRLFDTSDGDSIAARVIRIEELAGVLGLALVAAFFRRQDPAGAWNLPGALWLLVTLGLGTALGLLYYTMLASTRRWPELLVLTLGAIAFAAGSAALLQLSAVAVSFVAGVLLANFPGQYQTPLREMLKRLERPIYLLALFLIGAQWDVGDWRGWALMPVFMVARLAGKAAAAAIAGKSESMPIAANESRTLVLSPIGALAIAIVVDAQLLFPSGSISLVVSAVIGGGVLTEIFVQFASRRRARRARVEALKETRP